MHTDAYKSCRIHYNGGYDGYIYITNEDSTSKPLEKKANIRFTCRKLLNLYEKVKNQKTVTIHGLRGSDGNSEITILVEDIKRFKMCRLDEKIREKLDHNISTERLLKIAEILEIK
jgi:hypothetical protein